MSAASAMSAILASKRPFSARTFSAARRMSRRVRCLRRSKRFAGAMRCAEALLITEPIFSYAGNYLQCQDNRLAGSAEQRIDVAGLAGGRGTAAGVGDQHGPGAVLDLDRGRLVAQQKRFQAVQHLPHGRDGIAERERDSVESVHLVRPVLLVIGEQLSTGGGHVDQARAAARVAAS